MVTEFVKAVEEQDNGKGMIHPADGSLTGPRRGICFDASRQLFDFVTAGRHPCQVDVAMHPPAPDDFTMSICRCDPVFG